MHIPDSMLQGSVCPVTAVISTVGIGAATWFALRSKDKPSPIRFAAVAALVFAAQMINFPIQNGTSGHLIGGVLASLLLGTPFGVLSVALVVVLQSLMFSDGGVSVLGANVLNMAILGAGAGGWLASKLRHTIPGAHGLGGIALASWASVMLAALACSMELALAGTISFAVVLPPMLITHAVIGLGEALITVLLLVTLTAREPKPQPAFSVGIVLFATLCIALLLSPFASGFPDGLEWVASKYHFLHESAPLFVAPIPDYAVPGIGLEILATSMAGLLGVLSVFAMGILIAGVWRSSAKS